MMKKYVKSSSDPNSLVDEFMRYHEDLANYENNRVGFDKMYDILSKYGNENESVDEVFVRAPETDQRRMVNLIRPNDNIDEAMTVDQLSEKMYKLLHKQEKGATSSYEDGYVDGLSDAFNTFGVSI